MNRQKLLTSIMGLALALFLLVGCSKADPKSKSDGVSEEESDAAEQKAKKKPVKKTKTTKKKRR